jgi:xanthine dehydrogenase YagS FAD-binding subunit
MKPFAWLEPTTLAEAIAALGQGAGSARPIAGGSDLLGELKDGIAHYGRLVSLARIEALRTIAPEGKGLRIGAAVTLAQLEHEPRLAGPLRILAEAARGVATPEIRNQGTLGGNLCQRPRCLHYRSPWIDCLKKGGSGCPALESSHQPYLSVMGGPGCHAVHASDLAPPLQALEATVEIAGARGGRTLPLAEFFAGPEQNVRRENVLAPDELLTAVLVAPPADDWQGTYLKARERTAGDFPLVSVAFGCSRSDGHLRHVRMVLGGVAPTPLRCAAAEALLEGQSPTPALAAEAARVAFERSAPLAHNAYKIDLGRALVARAVEQTLS